MHEVTFTLETVTPLFLAGANQEEAELRAPSFRGVLRYWLRALLGGLYGSNALEKIREQEEAVFGSTKHGSPVIIRLRQESLLKQENATKWGFQGGNRKCYTPGQTFTLTLGVRQPGQQEALSKAIVALWLLANLGSLGAHARRCWGSLAVTPPSGWNGLPSFDLSERPDAGKFAEFLRNGLIQARGLYQSNAWHAQQRPQFDVLAPNVCHIWVFQDNKRWEEAETARAAIERERRAFRWSQGAGRSPCPLLLRVARLEQNLYVGVAVLFYSSSPKYPILKQWVTSVRHWEHWEVKW